MLSAVSVAEGSSGGEKRGNNFRTDLKTFMFRKNIYPPASALKLLKN